MKTNLAEPFSHCSSGFWYDSRLRCDVVDLYYELYGRKKPVSVPLPELAALRPQKVEKPKGDKDVGGGGGGGKVRDSSRERGTGPRH